MGRFISEDPIGFAGGVNFYAYVGSNPLGHRDPSGQDWKTFVKGVGIGVGAVVVTGAAAAQFGLDIPNDVAAIAAIVATATYVKTQLDPSISQDDKDQAFGEWVGAGLATTGGEIQLANRCRMAPVGNRTGNKFGEWPHYHRPVPDPTSPGNSLPGHGVGRHRPWETKATDTSFWDRF